MTTEEYELTRLDIDSRFTLTGSRYWNKLNPTLVPLALDTDYDYVAEYSDTLIEEFKNRGFYTRIPEWSNGKTRHAQRYSDSDTIVVLYLGRLQLILKENVQNYVELQSILTPEFYVRYLWKRYSPISYIQDTLHNLLRKPVR